MTQSCVITLDTGEIRRNSGDCGAHNDSRTHVNHTLEKTITKKKTKTIITNLRRLIWRQVMSGTVCFSATIRLRVLRSAITTKS